MFSLAVLFALIATPLAQDGLIIFADRDFPFVMRADGTEVIPLASRGMVQDISRGGGPATIVWAYSEKLKAIQIDDADGELVDGELVSLEPPGGQLPFYNGTIAAAINLAAGRLAYMSWTSAGRLVWLADLVQDPATGRVVGAVNHRLLVDTADLGTPADAPAGYYQRAQSNLSFSPDGDLLALEDWGDLWIVGIDPDGELDPFTTRRVLGTAHRFEGEASFSPDGTQLVFIGSDYVLNRKTGRFSTFKNHQVFTIDVTRPSSPVARVAKPKKGSSPPLSQHNFPDWSPDGTQIAFSARLSTGDYEVFVVDVGGSGVPQQVTSTILREKRLRWGWGE